MIRLSVDTSFEHLGLCLTRNGVTLANYYSLCDRQNSKIIFEPLPEDDPKQRQPDIPLAKSKLDWKPKTHLKEGLEKTIQYFDQILTS